jgi:Uma2 family endonuclease
MTAVALKKRLLSEVDYLAGEEDGEVRHEYLAGEVYAMSGASARHNTICCNLLAALHRHLAGSPCRVFMSDLKVRLKVLDDTCFYYPDVMVACRPEDSASHFREQPCVLVEVMSATSERTDRREKLLAYREIAALEEYVLIAQDKSEVIVYRRAAGWASERPAAEGSLNLQSLSFSLPLAALYAGADAPD